MSAFIICDDETALGVYPWGLVWFRSTATGWEPYITICGK